MRERLKPGTKPTEGESRTEAISVNFTPKEFEFIRNIKPKNESMGYYCYKIIKQYLQTIKD